MKLEMRETLGEVLAEKRELSKETMDVVKQYSVAKAIGKSPGWVSMLEKDTTSAKKLTGDETVRLLEVYGFNVREIKQIIEHFGLNFPRSYLQTASLPGGSGQTGGVTHVRYLSKVSHGTLKEELQTVNETYALATNSLYGYDPADIYTIPVTGDLLASPIAHHEIPEGAMLICHETLEPTAGEFVLVDLPDAGKSALIRWREDGTDPFWLYSYDASLNVRPVQVTPETRLEPVGVVLSESRPRTRRISFFKSSQAVAL